MSINLTSEEREEIQNQINNLPITQYKDKLIQLLKENDVIIVVAETWSWKSTQLIQYFSDFWYISSTQPRVPAAINLAWRVTSEKIAQAIEWEIVEEVWFKTGNYKTTWKSNQEFHTDWYTFARLTSIWDIEQISKSNKLPDVVILDEFHTYSVATEWVAYLLKEVKKIKNKKRNLKIVITSATIDAVKIREYFSEVNWWKEIPIENIPWRTYPVEYSHTWKAEHIRKISKYYDSWKSVLVFESWKKESKKTLDELKIIYWEDLDIRMLNRDMSDIELKNNMQVPISWKAIIVATNIAQESLTIPWIDSVVDSWKVKEAKMDEFWVQYLIEQDEPRSWCIQRAWRAWRVKAWVATRTNDTDFEELEEYRTPPIKLSTLDWEVLRFLNTWIDVKKEEKYIEEKKWENASIFPNKPDKKLLDLTYERLEKLWAIEQDELWNYFITDIWYELMKYPISPSNAKIILEWISRWVTRTSIKIAAISENESFYTEDKKLKIRELYNEKNKDSDIFDEVKVFKILTSRRISSINLDMLEKIWFSSESIQVFIEWNWKIMFYEALNEEEIELFWIKVKVIKEILDTINEVERKLIKRRININDELSWSELFKQLKYCILSWSIFYLYNLEWNLYIDSINTTNNRKFMDSKNSRIEKRHWTYLYTWTPFVIIKEWKETSLLLRKTIFSKKEINEFDESESLMNIFFEDSVAEIWENGEQKKEKRKSTKEKKLDTVNKKPFEIEEDKKPRKEKEDKKWIKKIGSVEGIKNRRINWKNYLLSPDNNIVRWNNIWKMINEFLWVNKLQKLGTKDDIVSYLGRYISHDELEINNIENLRRTYVLIKYIPYIIFWTNKKILSLINKFWHEDIFKENIYKVIDLFRLYLSKNHRNYLHLVSHRVDRRSVMKTFENDTTLIDDFMKEYPEEFKSFIDWEKLNVEIRYNTQNKRQETELEDDKVISLRNSIKSALESFDKRKSKFYSIWDLKWFVLDKMLNDKDTEEVLNNLLIELYSSSINWKESIEKLEEVRGKAIKSKISKNKLVNLLSSIEDFINWDKESIWKLFKLYKTKDQLLLNDKKVNEKLKDLLDELKKKYKNLKTEISNLGLPDKISKNMLLVFSTDQRRRKRWIRVITDFYKYLLNKRNNWEIWVEYNKIINYLDIFLSSINDINIVIDDLSFDSSLYWDKQYKKDLINAVAVYITNWDYDTLYDSEKIEKSNKQRYKIEKLLNELWIRKQLWEYEANILIDSIIELETDNEEKREILIKHIKQKLTAFRELISSLEEKIDSLNKVENEILEWWLWNIRKLLYDIIRQIHSNPELLYERNLNSLIVKLFDITNKWLLSIDELKKAIMEFMFSYRFEHNDKLAGIFDFINDYEIAVSNLDIYNLEEILKSTDIDYLESEYKYVYSEIWRIKKARAIVLEIFSKIWYQYLTN